MRGGRIGSFLNSKTRLTVEKLLITELTGGLTTKFENSFKNTYYDIM
jgi:hypothetical protein